MKYLLFLGLVFFIACENSAEKEREEKEERKENKKQDDGLLNGETLFKANCSSCHKPNEKYVGPALQGVTARWGNKELLYAFVRNSQQVISRNAYAKKLYNEYNQSPMLPYPNLTDNDIKNILVYCDTYMAP